VIPDRQVDFGSARIDQTGTGKGVCRVADGSDFGKIRRPGGTDKRASHIYQRTLHERIVKIDRRAAWARRAMLRMVKNAKPASDHMARHKA
jgi:hypothetical protein